MGQVGEYRPVGMYVRWLSWGGPDGWAEVSQMGGLGKWAGVKQMGGQGWVRCVGRVGRGGVANTVATGAWRDASVDPPGN